MKSIQEMIENFKQKCETDPDIIKIIQQTKQAAEANKEQAKAVTSIAAIKDIVEKAKAYDILMGVEE